MIICFAAKNGICERVWTVKWTGPGSSLNQYHVRVGGGTIFYWESANQNKTFSVIWLGL